MDSFKLALGVGDGFLVPLFVHLLLEHGCNIKAASCVAHPSQFSLRFPSGDSIVPWLNVADFSGLLVYHTSMYSYESLNPSYAFAHLHLDERNKFQAFEKLFSSKDV
ncbi:hypothetical protein SLEP1_g52251 [Rubroshorea leprosula]|uniref:Uncharacterized protein n=1 Tax=Rubroshorea leprosula TaxID=152421 RepID=A0AAV5M6R1_9ROSI|nr:hypothetical protein SLEP1_g52251 [Rubroshorea leprosula]